MTQPTELIVTETSHTDPDVVNGAPHGTFTFKAAFLDEEGKYQEGADITMTSEDNLYGNSITKKTNGVTKKKLKDWNTSFSYVPQESGERTILFSSNGIEKEIELNVT